jgi:VWFA-related protein
MQKFAGCVIRFLILSGFLAAIAPSNAQTESPHLIPRTKEERRAQEQRRFTLAAVVTDASGMPVTGLKLEDFQLIESGKPQKIVRFQEVRNPTSAQIHGLIVVDAINNSTSAIHRQRKELKSFLANQKTLPYPIAIVVAANGGVLQGDLSSDPSVLMQNLEMRTKDLAGSDCDTAAPGADLESRMSGRVSADSQGASGSRTDCRREHFVESMNALRLLFALQGNSPGRAVVIWLGPGWPLPPEQNSGQIMGTAGPARAGDIVVGLSDFIRDGQITFDAVSWSDYPMPRGTRRQDAMAKISAASLAEQEALLTVPALAEQSGGVALAKSKNIPDAISLCLQNEESYYTLVFDPEPAGSTDEYRTINVRVAKPGAAVRAMHSYFEQP